MKKLRTLAVILITVGSFLLVFSIGMSAISAYNRLNGPSTIGLIGGIDASMVWSHFCDRFVGRFLPIAVTGALLIAVAVLLLIIERKRKK